MSTDLPSPVEVAVKRVGDQFHRTRLTHEVYIDPNNLALLLKAAGYYDPAPHSPQPAPGAVEAMREACAKVAEGVASGLPNLQAARNAVLLVADAIRDLATPSPPSIGEKDAGSGDAEVEGLVERLNVLLARATPLPWDSDSTKNEGEYGRGPNTSSGFDSYHIGAGPANNWVALFDTLNSDAIEVEEEYDLDYHHAWDRVGKANTELVVAAVNALPTLLAALQSRPQPALPDDVREAVARAMFPNCWSRHDAGASGFAHDGEIAYSLTLADAALTVVRERLNQSGGEGRD